MFVIYVLKIAVLVSSLSTIATWKASRISLKHHRLRLHTAQRPVISSNSRSSSRTSKSNSLEVLLHHALEADSRALFKATLIILTPKGKARYPAFQIHRKHITALSPTQTYTPKRASTPLIHIRCILPRFPSWHLNELPLECRCERNLRNTLGINCPKVAQGVIQNCLRSTVVSVYACRQLKAGDAAQPKGCFARFVLWCAHQFARVVHKNTNSENG